MLALLSSPEKRLIAGGRGPSAMLPAIAEIYLNHDAIALHDCTDCGFEVPITPGGNRVSAVRHFEACPLCGGRTGYAAYFKRRKAEANESQQ